MTGNPYSAFPLCLRADLSDRDRRGTGRHRTGRRVPVAERAANEDPDGAAGVHAAMTRYLPAPPPSIVKALCDADAAGLLSPVHIAGTRSGSTRSSPPRTTMPKFFGMAWNSPAATRRPPRRDSGPPGRPRRALRSDRPPRKCQPLRRRARLSPARGRRSVP